MYFLVVLSDATCWSLTLPCLSRLRDIYGFIVLSSSWQHGHLLHTLAGHDQGEDASITHKLHWRSELSAEDAAKWGTTGSLPRGHTGCGRPRLQGFHSVHVLWGLWEGGTRTVWRWCWSHHGDAARCSWCHDWGPGIIRTLSDGARQVPHASHDRSSHILQWQTESKVSDVRGWTFNWQFLFYLGFLLAH